MSIVDDNMNEVIRKSAQADNETTYKLRTSPDTDQQFLNLIYQFALMQVTQQEILNEIRKTNAYLAEFLGDSIGDDLCS